MKYIMIKNKRITEKIDKNIWEMKFLHNILEELYWSSEDDYDEINKKYIFYGLIKMVGTELIKI